MRMILIVADYNRSTLVRRAGGLLITSNRQTPPTKVPTVRIYLRLVAACKLLKGLEAAIGIEPMNKGFADLCLTTWLRRHNQDEE
jgi:hypothetical protein